MLLFMFTFGALGCGSNSQRTPSDAGNEDAGNSLGGTGGTSSACPGGCSGAIPHCDTVAKKCVQCLVASDCSLSSASACVSGTCTACTTNADCSHITSKGVCNSGTCVTCTAGDESACDGFSCNPKTFACTQTRVDSVDFCGACLADSECIGGDPADGGTVTARCVPMTFNGPAHGSYCLQRVASGCTNPYKVPISSSSLSGASTEDYCGINQTATTCEAVFDLIASKTCSADGDCGNGKGGLCKTVGVDANRCTIPCDSAAQCLASAPGNTCTTALPYCH